MFLSRVGVLFRFVEYRGGLGGGGVGLLEWWLRVFRCLLGVGWFYAFLRFFLLGYLLIVGFRTCYEIFVKCWENSLHSSCR